MGTLSDHAHWHQRGPVTDDDDTFEFGIFDSFDLGDSTPGEVIDDRLTFAQLAEAHGFGHYHVTEHHGTPLSVCPSPNLFLAALAQRTTRMRIGALVHVLPAYHPLRLAEEIATLDQMTHGRLDVGVGSGVSPYELAYFGVDAAKAKDIYRETLGVLTTALATGHMTHQGTLLPDIDAELSVRPVQQPHPPLWYASSNTATAEWAGANNVSFVGRWNSGAFTEAAGAYWRSYDTRPGQPADGGEQEQRRPRLGVAARVYIGETDGAALERFRKANDVMGRHLTKLWHDHDDYSNDALFQTDTMLARGNALVGSAATVRDQLIEQVQAVPVNYFEATLSFGDLTLEESLANLAAFAHAVMPAVREATEE
jgi:alkanesulfonate monooxygenase SsuD/methylene tetrahydromethanopterin reductase-like flavin-dependent oxidoreductase (luciferase family)